MDLSTVGSIYIGSKPVQGIYLNSLQIWPSLQKSLNVMSKMRDISIGTLNNPILYEQGMALSKGKYYVQYDVVYECIKNTNGVKKDLYKMPTYAKAVDNE